MRDLPHRVSAYAPPAAAGLLALACAAALWLTREQPLTAGPLRLDSLSLFFGLVLLASAAVRGSAGLPHPARALALALGAALALAARSPLLVGLGLLLAALVATPWPALPKAHGWRGAAGAAAQVVGQLPLVLAATCAGLAQLLLAAGGVAAYDDRLAGAALSNQVFWFTLLGAAAPLLALGRCPAGLAMLWLYPLARLYMLGPWNSGWSLAAALFGGALGLWRAWQLLRTPAQGRRWVVLGGLALACMGLASSAGVAAGCFLALVAALDSAAEGDSRSGTPAALAMLAPLAAVWMAVGAAAAAGVGALASATWAAALLLALAWALRPASRRASPRAAAVSVAAVVALPLLLALIEPVVQLLQGGLSPYGDVTIWPWVGAAFVSASQARVAALPSVMVGLLMLVLLAAMAVLDSLRGEAEAQPSAAAPEDLTWLWDALRDEVPWLGSGKK
ncbi:hypothetical protein F8S13_07835 [Chloroflexia bacterium SDU3-3]|nr:hypothetical protein F8S13_07835 [Chloroflexia bacterium SDU3-3]